MHSAAHPRAAKRTLLLTEDEMADTTLQLDHLNLPARDPEGLARWYAQTLGLTADAHRVRGQGVLIAFQKGEPVNRAPELHVGFRVSSMAVLTEWSTKLGGTLKMGPEFNSFQIPDPEGNCVELYCRADS
jgi:catechol-2,3-dioxygenase